MLIILIGCIDQFQRNSERGQGAPGIVVGVVSSPVEVEPCQAFASGEPGYVQFQLQVALILTGTEIVDVQAAVHQAAVICAENNACLGASRKQSLLVFQSENRKHLGVERQILLSAADPFGPFPCLNRWIHQSCLKPG